MKLIVGLGNPGKDYIKTRHNIGFIALDCYAEQYNLKFKNKYNGLYAETIINGEKTILLKPLSYMNLSGDVVRKYFDYYNLSENDILVIYDDVVFKTGTFKIKRGGSSAGHNGINDIINKIGTEKIARVRIGTSKTKTKLFDYVLGEFSKTDYERILNILPTINNIINDFPALGIDGLMAKYNKKDKNEEETVWKIIWFWFK